MGQHDYPAHRNSLGQDSCLIALVLLPVTLLRAFVTRWTWTDDE